MIFLLILFHWGFSCTKWHWIKQKPHACTGFWDFLDQIQFKKHIIFKWGVVFLFSFFWFRFVLITIPKAAMNKQCLLKICFAWTWSLKHTRAEGLFCNERMDQYIRIKVEKRFNTQHKDVFEWISLCYLIYILRAH